MRLLHIAAALMGAVLAVVGSASASAQVDRSQFEVSFEARETNRRAVLAKGLTLSPEQAEEFWPVYDAYRDAIKDIELRSLMTLSAFAESFQDLDDEAASDILETALEIEKDRTRLANKHIKRARRILSPVDALRYFQMEAYINTAQRFALQRQVPLAGTDLEALYRQSQALERNSAESF